MEQNKRLLWIRIVSILAIILSFLLVYEHYRTTPSEFCTFGKSFNCDIINKSVYSNVDGIFYFLSMDLGFPIPLLNLPIPISIISIIVFLFIISSTYTIQKKENFFKLNPKNQIKLLKWIMVISILFALYLVYIEKFVLLAWCLYCIWLDLLIVIETVLISRLK